MTKDSTIIQSSSRLENAYDGFTPSDGKLCTIINIIPVLTWCMLVDGSGGFYNRRWRDYTGLSLEASRDCGWTIAIHADDLDELKQRWRARLDLWTTRLRRRPFAESSLRTRLSKQTHRVSEGTESDLKKS